MTIVWYLPSLKSTSSILTHVQFPLCLHRTQTTIPPGMYVKQINQTLDQGMHDDLKVPITVISDADIARCENLWMGQLRHQVPHATWRELIEQGEGCKDTMQRIIFPARFEDAMPSECRVICMWYEGP